MPRYATPSDMINCFDATILGDVASDSGVTVAQSDLATDQKILSALSRASGEVESACLAGGMYSVSDLSSLADNALAMLTGLVCSLAMCLLLQRRPNKSTAELLEGVCKDARNQLQALRKGEAVFGGTTNATDGQLPETTGITTIQVNTLNMWRDQTRNYYPHRTLPDGR